MRFRARLVPSRVFWIGIVDIFGFNWIGPEPDNTSNRISPTDSLKDTTEEPQLSLAPRGAGFRHEKIRGRPE